MDRYIDYVKDNQANLVKGCVVLCTQRQAAGRGKIADVEAAMTNPETVVGNDNAEIYQIEAGTEKPGKELRDVWNAMLGENMKMLLGDCVAPKLMVPWRWGPAKGGGGNGRDFGLINAANNNQAGWKNTTVDGAAKAIANWGKSEDSTAAGDTKTRKEFIEKTPAGLYLMTSINSTKSANSDITSLNTSAGNEDHGYKLIFKEGHASMGKTKPTKIKELREKLNRLIWDTAGAAQVRQEADPNFDPDF